MDRLYFKLIFIAVTVFVLVDLSPVKAEEIVLCPDSETIFNFEYKVPKETLVNGPEIEPNLALIHQLPEDVACTANYDDVIIETHGSLGLCANIILSNGVRCQQPRSCATHIKTVLIRYGNILLPNMETWMIIKLITYFNRFLPAKKVLFESDPLSSLSVAEIFRRATTGPINILQGFSLPDGKPVPTRDDFLKTFSPAVKAYKKIKSFRTNMLTGFLKKSFEFVSYSDHTTRDAATDTCAHALLTRLKNKVSYQDHEFITSLEEGTRLLVEDLSDGKKEFDKLKIPLTEECLKEVRTAKSDSNFKEMTESFKL